MHAFYVYLSFDDQNGSDLKHVFGVFCVKRIVCIAAPAINRVIQHTPLTVCWTEHLTLYMTPWAKRLIRTLSRDCNNVTLPPQQDK